jgi:hypothetical protein
MTNLFQIASDQAKAYRDQILKARQPDYATSVEVVPLVLGPDLVTRVPIGSHHYSRCHADQFEAGRLTITAQDDGYDVRTYEPGTWKSCTVRGPDGHIAYSWEAHSNG